MFSWLFFFLMIRHLNISLQPTINKVNEMAINKDVVKAKFDVKFGKVNLSKTFKDSTIKKIADRLDSEDDIDATLDTYEDLITDAAAEADRVRTQARKEAENKDPKTTKDPEEFPKPTEDTPAWAKGIADTIASLKSEVAAFKAEKTKESLTERFNNDPRIKEVPAFMRLGYIPTNEEELETKVNELNSAYTTFAQENKIKSAGADATGQSPTGKGAAEKQFSNELEAWSAQKGIGAKDKLTA